MSKTYILSPSTRADKKWMVVSPSGKTVHFGATGYEDYTTHRDYERMNRYVMRHRSRENWGKSGIATAGFWSKHLLWNRTTLAASIRDTETRFGIIIRRARR